MTRNPDTSQPPKKIVASRFSIPFYLRLPTGFLLGWEPEAGVCAILPFRRLGEVSFSSACSLTSPAEVLDSYGSPIVETPEHEMLMTCQLANGLEIPTLKIKTGAAGGFHELRSYSELVVFVLVAGPLPPLREIAVRVAAATNHLIDIYRAVTQDPFVRRLDFDLDLFVIDYSFGVVGSALAEGSPIEIFRGIESVSFSAALEDHRFQYRLNTWEDLFPGPVLEHQFIQTLATMLPRQYELPLHYDLIFRAQSELKARNYHIAVLEAETAFEVYVAALLLRIVEANGGARADVLSQMEDPSKLGLLKRRLRRLDELIKGYRSSKGLPAVPAFVGSQGFRDWEDQLYKLRNRITHGGLRMVSFDDARLGISAGKKAIHEIESVVPDYANPVQIASEVTHLQNTAGRLRW